ncbi:DUF3048 domain-containing protein [Candidatus Uhrbacteria bacterium]|nr:DUF3048 domain-containing protein [Candidatus Uhrbacteria bacterium]
MMAAVVIAIIRDDGNPVAFDDLPAEETVIRHPLTGEPMEATLPELPQVFGVMIENSSDAWPLAGLEDAFLVIEAPVEGNIPRFIAFFSEEQDVEKIGPVRSARPYYLDWNDELDAVYAHVGGSPEALGLLAEYGTIDLNEFYQGEYFYRWGARYAPHNVYTTTDDLRAARDELAPETPVYDAWTFTDGVPSGEEKSLSIDWTTATAYDVTWDYDAEANAYLRTQGGTGRFLEGSADAVADNVVVMESDVTVVDAVGRRHIRTTGEGSALVAQNGRMIVATWKKDARTDRLRFSDAEGNEIAMNAGTTWIEVVPSLGQVTITDTETTGE